ncbi:MAG TPA: SprT family zinc-dependent metalloprotease [Rickettsiales bacterium]|nr:SprT family zinc-dependent metalloprotease [Rickettsiales bacterium]
MEGNYNNLFNYKITYSKNRKRTIGFKIINDTLNIMSPTKVSQKFLLSLLEKRKDWTIKRLEKRKSKRQLIQDNKILFLGKEFELIINCSDLLKEGGFCEIKDFNLIINITNNYSEKLLKETIENWYKKECLKIISDKVKYYSDKYNFNYGTIKVKEQKTVWGTCNSKNNLSFNWKAILFEEDVVDYLVVHELSHTIHRNHSTDFWKTVESILSNYKELNKKLK